MAIKPNREQIYYLMGAWDEYYHTGEVTRKCPICSGKLQLKELSNGAYQVTCPTPNCIDQKFRGL